MRSFWVSSAFLLSACGGAAPPVTTPEPEPVLEHWETVTDLRFTSSECVVGPFHVAFPERDVEFGRRVVFEVLGERGVEMSSNLNTVDRMQQWGVGITRVETDNARCRAPDAVVASASSTGAGAPPAGESANYMQRIGEYMDAPPTELPQLDTYEGELPSAVVQFGAVGWFPSGDAWYWADDLFTSRDDDATAAVAGAARDFRFWFAEPTDLRGVVIRVREEVLVPDLPLPEYRARFAVRVREAQQLAASRVEEQRALNEDHTRRVNERCDADPTAHGCASIPMPPPPLAEERPAAPGPRAEWLAGYWAWNVEANDFFWIEGTYVVRPEVVVVASAPPPEPSARSVIAAVPEAVAVEPIPVPSEPPAPRAEVVKPPPTTTGALWVRGHWELRAGAWVWSEGVWTAPPRVGMRFRAPAVRVQAGVRVFLPGGWIELR